MDLTRLGATGTCDLTTTGRRSGRPVQVEIWYVVAAGDLIITGTPGPRHWLANLRREPRARLRFRDPSLECDVLAEEVTEPELRRALIPEIWASQPWYAQQPYSQDDWVAGAPLVTLHGLTGPSRRRDRLHADGPD